MRVVPVLSFALVALAAAPAAAGLRCDGRLVTVGDTQYELRAKCGAPDHVQVQPRLQSLGILRRGQGVVSTTRELVETWTYLPEAGALARLVTLERGRVVHIEALAALHFRADPGCGQARLRKGATMGEVELSCGAPSDRSTWEEEYFVRGRQGLTIRRLRTRSRWVYDPGPGRLLRVLEFVNGRLARIDTGGHSP